MTNKTDRIMTTFDKVKELLGGTDFEVRTDVITGDIDFIGFGDRIRETRMGAIGVYRHYRVFNTPAADEVRVKDMKGNAEERMSLDEFEKRFA